MTNQENKLPSNRKFGFFFTFIFIVVSSYFYHVANITWAYIFGASALGFLSITLIKDEILRPLNEMWMRLGLTLGTVISPLVLGVIFFGLFTPIAVILRLSGRDELRLKSAQISSYWILRSGKTKAGSFENQF